MRPARALIDLAALRHNYRLARELGGRKALAVVKADAYGHGAVRCARALEPEADGFGVACIEEALELREAGIRAPILLLEGFFEAAELALIEAHDLWFVVQADWQIDAIERSDGPKTLGDPKHPDRFHSEAPKRSISSKSAAVVHSPWPASWRRPSSSSTRCVQGIAASISRAASSQ